MIMQTHRQRSRGVRNSIVIEMEMDVCNDENGDGCV